MRIGVLGMFQVKLNGCLVCKLRALQCLPSFGNLLEQNFPICLFGGELVLYLGAHVLVGL